MERRLRVRGRVLGPGGQAGRGPHRNWTVVSVLRCGRSSNFRAGASGKSDRGWALAAGPSEAELG